MNFFTRKTTWTNLELIPLKLAIGSVYLLLGAIFWQYAKTYAEIIGIIFIITIVITHYLWRKKMKEKS
jgi:hypothetical protein